MLIIEATKKEYDFMYKKNCGIKKHYFFESVQQLIGQNATLLKQNENLTVSVAKLTDKVDKRNQTIKKLWDQLNKNFRNSFNRHHLTGLRSRQ